MYIRGSVSIVTVTYSNRFVHRSAAAEAGAGTTVASRRRPPVEPLKEEERV